MYPVVVKFKPAGVVTDPETVTVPAVPPKVKAFVDVEFCVKDPETPAVLDQLAEVEDQVSVPPL
ncbi:MAG: hypothetical protein EBZ77_17185 [Chitinophagia bacterium]|nr:hypothetical protein [Chitinophagia bacterium]